MGSPSTLSELNAIQEVVSPNLSPPVWPSHGLSHKWTHSHHGNGVADSLPSGSGNLDVQLGRQRLPLAYLLRTLKLRHRAVEGPFHTGLVAEQTIQPLRVGDTLSEDFHFPPIGFDRSTPLLVLFEAGDLGINLFYYSLLALFRRCISFALSHSFRNFCRVEIVWILITKGRSKMRSITVDTSKNPKVSGLV
jgi:hypothetical protein